MLALFHQRECVSTKISSIKEKRLSRNRRILTRLRMSHLGLSDSSLSKWEGHSIFQEKIIVITHWRDFKIVFSKTYEPISTKLGTKHPWLKGNSRLPKWRTVSLSKGREKKNKNLILQNHWINLNKIWLKATLEFEGAHFFPSGENTVIAKFFFFRTNWPI